jgi:hypothetical protein
MLINRPWRHVVCAFLLAPLGPVGSASAAPKPRIVPVRVTATYSSQSRENQWSLPVKSTDGSTVYVLSLEPDFDVGHHVITLELVLRGPSGKAEAPNLLDPTGKRHGLQAYDFSANDLAHGVQESAFGKKRMISLYNLGLVLTVSVSKVAVRPVSDTDYQLDALDLQIEVDNINP